MFSNYTDLPFNRPSPDLIIRTGGERRLSNFMLWHAAYSEIEFSDILWPDFNYKHLEKSINQLNVRERRFGGLKDASNKLSSIQDNTKNKIA